MRDNNAPNVELVRDQDDTKMDFEDVVYDVLDPQGCSDRGWDVRRRWVVRLFMAVAWELR